MITPFNDPKTDISSICYANKYMPPEPVTPSLVYGPVESSVMDPESIIAKSENFGVIFKGVMPEGFSMSSFLERKME